MVGGEFCPDAFSAYNVNRRLSPIQPWWIKLKQCEAQRFHPRRVLIRILSVCFPDKRKPGKYSNRHLRVDCSDYLRPQFGEFGVKSGKGRGNLRLV